MFLTPKEERIRTAVIDFDGTLATYDKWRGEDHYGVPIRHCREALLELKTWGWRVVIFTTRGKVEGVKDWLRQHGLPFDGVNSTKHNPPNTSHKPIADVYFDDRDAHVVGEVPYNWKKAMKRVRKLYQPERDLYIDDASIWAGWCAKFFGGPSTS